MATKPTCPVCDAPLVAFLVDGCTPINETITVSCRSCGSSFAYSVPAKQNPFEAFSTVYRLWCDSESLTPIPLTTRAEVLRRIEEERARQIEHGYDLQHDLQHLSEESLILAACYYIHPDAAVAETLYPRTWAPCFKKRDDKTRQQRFVIALSMIVAHMEAEAVNDEKLRRRAFAKNRVETMRTSGITPTTSNTPKSVPSAPMSAQELKNHQALKRATIDGGDDTV